MSWKRPTREVFARPVHSDSPESPPTSEIRLLLSHGCKASVSSLQKSLMCFLGGKSDSYTSFSSISSA